MLLIIMGIKKGTDPFRPFCHHGLEVVECRFYATLSASDIDSEFMGIQACRIKLRISDGQIRGCHCKLNDPVGALGFLVFHPLGRVKILDFRSEGDRAIRDIKSGVRPDAVFAFFQCLPVIFSSCCYRAHHSQPGNDNPSQNASLLRSRIGT